jgi:hypothetical protein
MESVMEKSKSFLTQLCLLLLLCLSVSQAAGQEAQVTSSGNQEAIYQVGHDTITEKGYLQETDKGLIPTTAANAQYSYELVVERVSVKADMDAMGSLAAHGSGITSAFFQTHTVDVSGEGTFENCPDKPFGARWTGTQSFQAQTNPLFSDGEVKGYGEQGVTYTIACMHSKVRPVGSSDNTDNSSQNNDSGPTNGRIVTSMEMYSHYENVPPTGTGVTGNFSQTHSLQLSPNPGVVGPGVTGTTTITSSQTTNNTTSN